jgi:secreted trypsin-like serine protease
MKKLFIIFFLSISASFAVPTDKQNKKTARISPTIINGTATTAPFYVLLGDPSSSGGGMIIADRWILTAGHTTSYAPVYAGIDNRNSITNSSALQVKDRIKDLYVNTPNPSNDIGLIQLSQPLIFSSTIAPIKLASSANASIWNNGQIGKVYGMGKTSTESYSQQLLTTNVNLLSNSSSVSEKKIYATGPYTNDACNGDSGGPLTNFSVSSDTSARAIGIVSSNLFGNAQFGCGEGGKYTKISDYLRWIIETIHLKSSPSKICGNTTFSNLSYLPDGVSFNWTASPANLFTNTSGSGLTFTTANNGSNKGWGIVTLNVTLPDGTSFSKPSNPIWVGSPENVQLTTDGTFSINYNSTSICKSLGYCMSASTGTGTPTATHFTYSGWPSYGSFLNTNTQVVTNDRVCFGTNNTGSYYLTVYANNGACSIGKSIIVNVNNCGYRIASNPTQSTLSILLDAPLQTESIPDNLDLYDEKNKSVKSLDLKQKKKDISIDPAHAFDLRKIDFDVADLPRGVYYLHLGFGSKKENQIDKIRILLN